jgi:hypothetical protein
MQRERWLVLAGLLLFLLSLMLPALVSESFPAQSGFDLFRQRGEFTRNGIFAWYANPVLGVALVLCWLGRFRLGLGAGLLGGALALSIFLAPATLESAGRSLPDFRFGAGFYVWLGAFICVISAAAAGLICPQSRAGIDPQTDEA